MDAFGSGQLLILKSAGCTSMLHPDTEELPTESVTRKRSPATPEPPGFPVSTPSPLSDNPEGIAPIDDHPYGATPPDACSRNAYCRPVIAGGNGHAVLSSTSGRFTA